MRASLAALAGVLIGGSMIGLMAPSHASDDYPYAGQGQCPIAVTPTPPAPVTPSPTIRPTPPTSGGHSGGHSGDRPGGTPGPKEPHGKPTPPTKPTPPPPPPTPVHDPISGHDYYPPAPRPECTRRVWVVNGSMGDPWGFALRNCTSFVAWRLRETNGFSDFANDFTSPRGSVHWGDANNWDDTARTLGYLVDGVPAIGAVAQTDDGPAGHVAWVESIGPGTVTIEEYNHYVPGGYGVRTVPTSDFTYLHLRDIAPAPYLGSTRPVVSIPTASGESWTARVSSSGDLLVSRPGHGAVRVGASGAFSTTAAPTIALDGQGRTWVAAVSSGGDVLAARTGRHGFERPRVLGAGTTTSSPVLISSGRGLLTLLSIDAAGDLRERHQLHGRWSPAKRLGPASSWAVHAAPEVASDSRGRLWAVAVTRAGGLRVLLSVGRGWSAPRSLDRGMRWSITSTPSLSAAPDGQLWMHAVTASGELVVHRLTGHGWGRRSTVPGSWSPYSSPAVASVAGHLWLAAVATDGRILVSQVGGSRPEFAVADVGASTGSVAFLMRSRGHVFVVGDAVPDRRLEGVVMRSRTGLARGLGQAAFGLGD